MRNNSMGIDLFHTAKDGNFEVKIYDRKSGDSLPNVPIHSHTHFAEVYYLGRLIFTDKDRQDRFYMIDLRSKTTNQTIGRIMSSVGVGKYSVRNQGGTLWVIKNSRRICRFRDGISISEIDKAEEIKDEPIKRLLKELNERLNLKNIP